jgi:hypothetical protein
VRRRHADFSVEPERRGHRRRCERDKRRGDVERLQPVGLVEQQLESTQLVQQQLQQFALVQLVEQQLQQLAFVQLVEQQLQ